MDINGKLKNYIDTKIIPIYKSYDKAHSHIHIQNVIDGALFISENIKHNIDTDIIYTAGAYHDIGLGVLDDKIKSCKLHHILSARRVLNDSFLKKYFNQEEIEIIAKACREHRASNKSNPHSIYSQIIADADRVSSIDIYNMIKRSYNRNIENYPEYDTDLIYQEVYTHLKDKFGFGGYAWSSLYLPVTKEIFGDKIKLTQKILNDESKFKIEYQKFINKKIKT